MKNELKCLLRRTENRHYETLENEEIRTFIASSLSAYGSVEKLREANCVADVLVAMLKKKKQITKHGSPMFVEILIAAALLHNLFYDGTPSSLFLAREKLRTFAEKIALPENGAEAIFQTVEGQLGDDTPIPACRPTPNSPAELFSWAVWIAQKYSSMN